MQDSEGQFYKIKLTSGRILGPIDLDRVRLLITKNQILGEELARLYPQGEWTPVSLIPEISELLVKHLSGALKDEIEREKQAPDQKTVVLPGTEAHYEASLASIAIDIDIDANGDPIDKNGKSKDGEPELGNLSGEVKAGESKGFDENDNDGEKTMVAGAGLLSEISPGAGGADPEGAGPLRSGFENSDDEKTQMATGPSSARIKDGFLEGGEGSAINIDVGDSIDSAKGLDRSEFSFSREKTIVLSTDSTRFSAKKGSGGSNTTKKKKNNKLLRTIVVVAALGMMVQELFFPDETGLPLKSMRSLVRPKLPQTRAGGPDPAQSEKLYQQGLRFYLLDTVVGYKQASELLLAASSLDINNVKALAMLASSYLNLIDSSNKDENYFSVISKLIEMSRAKAADLPETVIADVEFYVFTNQAEAAKNRIVEYSKTVTEIPLPMFYYLAFAYFYQGDATAAARYMSQIPDQKVPGPKMFYLRGEIAEKLNDSDAAVTQYKRAIEISATHAKSRLRIAALLAKKGQLKEAGPYLDYLWADPGLLAPKDLAEVYFLHAQLNSLFNKINLALGDMEKAVKLDPKNRDYLLELYTLRSKLGDVSPEFQKEARMYYYLGEGERMLKEAKNQDALSLFLQARQANLNSPVPLVKIGDLFMSMNDVANARINFKQAADLAPTAIEVWSRYIDALIRSYDWEEANHAMEKFRKLPVQQSAIDKLAGDIYAKQGQQSEAQILYRKAMAREVIDSSVYNAYANSLSASKLCKDAPFFYALALRFDPFNTEAIIGTAKCLASSESIDRGVVLLQDSLQKFSQPRADLLTAIAELQIQKGEWKAADQFVDQAMQVDASYAPPWKTKAQIYLQKQEKDPKALQKAIEAYGSYIERNPSDPTGYLERHQLLVRKGDYAGAEEDLNRLMIIYPKYPGVNLLKGQLYAKLNRPIEAKAAFQAELKGAPNSVLTLLELGRLAGDEGTPETMSEALKYFNQAVALAPNNAEAKAEAGWINFQMKNSPGAAAMLEAAISIDPGNPLFYRRLGYVYRSLGQTEQARKNFRKYLDMDPDAPDRPELERF